MPKASTRSVTGRLTRSIECEEFSSVTPRCLRSQRELGTSDIVHVGTQFEAMEISSRCLSSPSLSGLLQHASIDHKISRQSLGSNLTPDLDLPRPATGPNVPSILNWSSSDTETRDDSTTHEDNGPTGLVFIHRELVLDKAAQSNVLPFVLQGFSAWISRLALDPRKLTRSTRDFVLSQIEDGEQSRWIIALLANVGSRIGSVEFVEGSSNTILSMLQTAVRRRLGTANPKRPTLVQALSSAIQTTIIQFYASPLSEAMTLMYETAPIFRQLCPDPPDAPVDLHSLLRDPLDCLWQFAYIDIIFSVLTDMPTLCRYEVSIPGSRPSPYTSIQASQGDGIIQWLHGIPNQLVLFFAHMKSIRGDGITPDEGTVALLERGIREIPSFDGSSSDRFLTIMRSVIQECWRQAALIYLYMAVCGESSNAPRVKEAFKRYMRLLNGTTPGRFPDEFLILTLQLISPAAQRQRDREVLKQRALGLYTRDRTHISTTFITFVMADVWTRADDEGRPIMWSDIAMSRRKLLGV
ncbi:hypothetical protein B0J17DRAFT_713100 [Rhizoctonia solani]|nr:hypothetical protein B0J17DRAFT_713100 [Rhizoctonia solani]